VLVNEVTTPSVEKSLDCKHSSQVPCWHADSLICWLISQARPVHTTCHAIGGIWLYQLAIERRVIRKATLFRWQFNDAHPELHAAGGPLQHRTCIYAHCYSQTEWQKTQRRAAAKVARFVGAESLLSHSVAVARKKNAPALPPLRKYS